MSRDQLLHNAQDLASESKAATAPRTLRTPAAPQSTTPSAATLVSDLIDRVERDWAGSRPESQSLWQLAGE